MTRILSSLLLVLVACSSAAAPTAESLAAADRQAFLAELEDPFGRINLCELDSNQAEVHAFVGHRFDEMQARISVSGLGSLSNEEQTLHSAFSQRTSFPDRTDEVFEPSWVEGVFVSGETTWLEFVYSAGTQLADKFAWVLSKAWPEEVLAGEVPNYGDNLSLHCEFLEIQVIEELCAGTYAGSGPVAQDRACRDLEKIPDRDLAVIAQACEDLPYLMVCEPENPPTWFHPDADVGE